MELTDEMRAALVDILARYRLLSRHDPRPYQIDIDMCLAGYRMGQRDMRERAAQACGDYEDRWAESKGRALNEYELGHVNAAIQLAGTIRALPIEDANG